GHFGRGEIEQRPRRLELGCHVGEHELGVLELGNRASELLAFLRITHRLVKTALPAAERAGTDVEPPAVEPLHRDAEAFAFAADHVLRRHPHVLEDQRRGRLRMPPRLALRRAERNARHVLLDRQTRDAAWALAAGADHGQVQLVLAGPADELLGAVDDPVTAVPYRP